MALADHGPSTTERVVLVLTEFGASSAPLGVSDLARRCDLSKAVVHRILQTLVAGGFVRYLSESRKYAIGPAALALGHEAARSSRIREAALPVIAHLAAETGETATATERVGHLRHYVGQVESYKPIRITIRLGDQVPLWSGASGLSILAFLPNVDVDLVLRQPRTQYTDQTIVEEASIRERLAEIRERGWAQTAGERVPFSSSIAAPLFGPDGIPEGAISVATLADRAQGVSRDALAQSVVDAAAEASERYRRSVVGE
ncbi:IclR family transcriptional regulator [Microbacterium excoecariae]|uniref:IclR family transcriptional regulator n=1 Tax=Microbacterium excoecariae TaxID=2715210 RepID=UPI001409425A|nr:IclR family transcriptional regulator [Microbacterium excoecariae]NHI17681.1 IclR family transcriptional regulator [Microbacterium excoecariae]